MISRRAALPGSIMFYNFPLRQNMNLAGLSVLIRINCRDLTLLF